MAMLRHGIVLAVLMTLGLPVAAQPFRPSLTYCNRTESDVRVATAYDLAGTSQISSRGWSTVRGCTCRTIIQGVTLRATEVFLLANRGGTGNILKPARAPMCVRADGFAFVNENANPQSCAAAGGQWTSFKRYDTAGRAHRVNLRRTGECILMDP